MTYILTVHHVHDDGFAWSYEKPCEGTAQDAHDALAARWKAAGYTFTRDAATCTLTRRWDADPALARVETVRHVEVER